MNLSIDRTRTAKNLVVKIGTASLSLAQGGLDEVRIRSLAEELCDLQKQGWSVVLVTSGAIGAGMDVFGWRQRPNQLKDKQAAAAVGQVVLMEAYKTAFGRRGVPIGQMLLTRSDLEDRERYRNAQHTLSALLNLGVVPIINENDTIATDEIQFGDNDQLAALVAVKTNAKKLFLLTDVPGLLTSTGPEGKLLPEVFRITPEIEALARSGKGSEKSVGGMASKLSAAKLAMASGVEVWMAEGRRPGIIRDLLSGQGQGTRFQPLDQRLSDRQRWLAFGRRVKGTLSLDRGAVEALRLGHKSLLPSGVKKIQGSFSAGDTLRLLDDNRQEFARGLSAFSSIELRKIMGCYSQDIASRIGRPAPAEVIHRDHMVLLA